MAALILCQANITVVWLAGYDPGDAGGALSASALICSPDSVFEQRIENGRARPNVDRHVGSGEPDTDRPISWPDAGAETLKMDTVLRPTSRRSRYSNHFNQRTRPQT